MKTLPTPPGIDTPDFKYSHSITPDVGFDDEGGLVLARFRPEEANASVQDFVSLRRNISIALTNPDFGEQKAQSGEKACSRQLRIKPALSCADWGGALC
jgi:hypothetical protein